MNAWKLEHFRLTIFAQAELPEAPELWKRVLGEAPENEATQRVGGVSIDVAESPAAGGHISLRLTAGGKRVDWLVGRAQIIGASAEHPIVGEIEEYLKTFRDLRVAFIESNDAPVQRLAMGAVFLQPVANREHGYLKLGEYLRNYVKIDPASSDFQYRINRSRPSSVLGDSINRLSEWSVARFTNMEVSDPSAGAHAVRDEYMARLAADFNTSPLRRDPIGPQKQKEVLDELEALIFEVAAEGDVP